MTATLPSYATLLFDGYKEQPQPGVIRTDVETGPAKQTKTKSRVTVQRPVKIKFSSLANYVSFKGWVKDDISYGADWFNWTDPVDSTTKLGRMVGGQYEGDPQVKSLGCWIVSFTLETWDG